MMDESGETLYSTVEVGALICWLNSDCVARLRSGDYTGSKAMADMSLTVEEALLMYNGRETDRTGRACPPVPQDAGGPL